MTRNLKISIVRIGTLWDEYEACAQDIGGLIFSEANFFATYPDTDFELSIQLTDDAEVQSLNKKHRGKDTPTNVLSFPAYDPAEPHPDGVPINLGDVVLAHETIAREANEQGKSFEDHAAHLIVHGVLHLIGHDHEEDEEAKTMEALEIRILSGMGVKNPYEDR